MLDWGYGIRVVLLFEGPGGSEKSAATTAMPIRAEEEVAFLTLRYVYKR